MTKNKVDQPDDESTEVVVIESKKRVAADGTQRGLRRKQGKLKKDQLIDQIQAAIVADHNGDPGWDPVVMMAVIASRAHTGYPAVDDKGMPIIDEATGIQVMVPPNPELALVAAGKVAPFVHGHVKPKEPGEDDDKNGDPGEKEELLRGLLGNMGVPIEGNADD